MIHTSFKVCALTSAIDGSDDKDIQCFKEQQPCSAGFKLLTQHIKFVSESKDNPFVPDNDEITDAVPREMVVDEGQDGDNDIASD